MTRASRAGERSEARGPSLLTDFDLHLFGEGKHFDLYRKMGAQVVRSKKGAGEIEGVHFGVWAPNAERVSVVGSFNGWSSAANPMRPLGETGVWQAFVPGVQPGALYKYHLVTRLGGASVDKADPFGFRMQRRPDTASVVWEDGRYSWGDAAWMETRAKRQSLDHPISIYEVHPGSWKRTREGEEGWLPWRELAGTLIPYVRDLGYTHVELLPVSEHPFDGSWGYQPVGYYAPTSRFGTPDDFRAFVDAAHQAGLGVILDWVPAHFPKDEHGLGFFDGTHLYEHADPRKGVHKDWGTFVFNFGRPQVSGFLLANALYWLDRFHIDGLRVDAVASMLYLDYSRGEGEWVPNEHGGRENLEAVAFLRRFNDLVHERFPGALTIAEESTSWPLVTGPTSAGGLGFDLKWNMGWMHDTLEYMAADPLYRKALQAKLTFSIWYASTERFLLPFSHDEVVHGKRALLTKMPGDVPKRFANLRALYGFMFAHPGKKLLFMGAEFGQWREWSHDRQLDWHLLDEDPGHEGIRRYVRDLNRTLAAEPALHEMDFSPEGFRWIDFQDEDQSVIAFLRRARNPEDFVVVVAHFTPVTRRSYRVGVPSPGPYRVLLSGDHAAYGGTGLPDRRDLVAEEKPWHGMEWSIEITLPPLATVYVKPGRSV
ncbi:MAG TPA: 1,4-alpha-glucan branching protein GlgB [Candidatus Eisenbacteria bacterium]|nr:1,4-alpha-glucan branching protein GlgB [Candidatus Eisenbacteria bacterium]